MNDKELIEKCRLTPEEMGKVKFDMGSPWGVADRATVGKAIEETVITKAVPIIRAEEREKMVKILERGEHYEQGHDWGNREGAPVIIIELDPLVWQAIKEGEA